MSKRKPRGRPQQKKTTVVNKAAVETKDDPRALSATKPDAGDAKPDDTKDPSDTGDINDPSDNSNSPNPTRGTDTGTGSTDGAGEPSDADPSESTGDTDRDTGGDQSGTPPEDFGEVDNLQDPPLDTDVDPLDDPEPSDGLERMYFYEESMAPNLPLDEEEIITHQKRLWNVMAALLQSDNWRTYLHNILVRFGEHDCYKGARLHRGLVKLDGSMVLPPYVTKVYTLFQSTTDPQKRSDLSQLVDIDSLMDGMPPWLVERLSAFYG